VNETVTSWLSANLPHAVTIGRYVDGLESEAGDTKLIVARENLRGCLLGLKSRFHTLMDLFAVDYLGFPLPRPQRFAVVYNLFSVADTQRVFVKCYVTEDEPIIPSVCDLFASANWFEREAFDMVGIHFSGHPNLIRILCHQDFVGHPLRKDYPSDGYQRLKQSRPSKEL